MDEALTKALKVAIGNAELWQGDCLDVLRTLPDCSVDSIVTDPPYGLTANKKGGSGVASINLDSPYGRSRIGTGNGSGGFMGMKWDRDVPSVEVWRECLRVLKPGGHLLAFAGTRTQHRMAVRIEDGGFEIRDMIAWVYGSGFPKSLDVSKAIDQAAGAEREVIGPSRANVRADLKYGGNDPAHNHGRLGAVTHPPVTAPATDAARQWQGWGTALKPALEPITVARKPLTGTVAANVLAHGTGALNVDGCRVGTETAGWNGLGETPRNVYMGGWSADGIARPTIGRWPANLIHDGSEEVLAAFPQQTSGSRAAGVRKGVGYGSGAKGDGGPAIEGSSGSAARFFYCAKASRADREDGVQHRDKKPLLWSSGSQNPGSFQSPNTDRSASNHHPTVKPTDLMRYLCRLVTPPGGVVLDPFMGSGSTGKGAMLEGFRFIGIEREAEYVEIAKARIARAQAQGQLLSPEEPRECVQEGLL
jgi:site-specific DNA-methyltransferase (adenine-specific)